MKLTLFPESSYRLSLFPIIGEESNALIDDEGFDADVLSELEEKYIEQTERQYDIMFDFYASGNGMYYSIDDGDQDELEDNAINIDRSKYDLEEWEEEPDDDFRLIDKLQKDDDLNEDHQEVFNDIMNRHNIEEHIDIIVEAICCIAKAGRNLFNICDIALNINLVFKTLAGLDKSKCLCHCVSCFGCISDVS